MVRSIAILTLALTAALSADEASAWPLYVNSNVTSTFAQQNDLDAGGGSNLYQQNELELTPGDCTSALRDGDDLDALIAIIAFEYGHSANAFCGDDDIWVFLAERFEIDQVVISAIEYGPEAAYEMLRDMGFTPAEADDMVLGILVNNENIPAWYLK